MSAPPLSPLRSPGGGPVAGSGPLHDRLLERGRRRFALLSDQVALGATNFARRTVEVNPLALPFPEDPAERARVRHAPDAPLRWEQLLATALVEHEAGHICHSGEKPTASTLGWLWNALEDERQERRQWRATPELEPLFALLGDAAWRENQPTTDLLAGCLLWRWEEDHGASQRLFRPDPVAAKRWTREIRPLVEAAWEAATSDEVTQLAREILARLGLPEDAPPPAGLPQTICAGVFGKRLGGDAPDGAPQSSPATPLPDGVGLPTAGQPPSAFDASQAEADPTALLAQVEGFARDLALALHPPAPNQRPRPHRSRGDLVLERALEGQERPFAYERVAAPARQVALLVLVDQTGSMGKRTDAHSRMTGAVTATMLLHRAAELASIRFGVWGFTFRTHPSHPSPARPGRVGGGVPTHCRNGRLGQLHRTGSGLPPGGRGPGCLPAPGAAAAGRAARRRSGRRGCGAGAGRG